jgi:hypothetical protein
VSFAVLVRWAKFRAERLEDLALEELRRQLCWREGIRVEGDRYLYPTELQERKAQALELQDLGFQALQIQALVLMPVAQAVVTQEKALGKIQAKVKLREKGSAMAKLSGKALAQKLCHWEEWFHLQAV